jgi:cytidine deaminase
MKFGPIDEARQLMTAAGVPRLSPDDVRSLMSVFAGDVESLLRLLVPLAAERAVIPISKYPVGAVGLGVSGAIYLGANWEPPTGPLGDCVHAEQSVIAAALANRDTGLMKLAVSAAPCGHCRQFLWELSSAHQLMILSGDAPSTPLTELLPRPFGPTDLGKHPPLLAHPDVVIRLTAAPSVPVASAAMAAAARSYTPYSTSPAGLGVATRDGMIVAGSYIENVAYNPSVSPVLAAMTQLAQLGRGGTDIVEAILVCTHDSTIDHETWAKQLLAVIAPEVSLQIMAVSRE